MASRPPSPTNDHKPPAPAVVAEVMRSERLREAFGTCVRAALGHCYFRTMSEGISVTDRPFYSRARRLRIARYIHVCLCSPPFFR